MIMAHLGQISQLSRFMAAQARILIQDGRIREGLKHYLVMRRMAAHTGDNLIISYLVRVSIKSMADQGLRQVLSQGSLNYETLTWLKHAYTYKTKEYSLYCVQDYHPGTYGDQQHVAGMNIGNSFSVFHTHPAMERGVPRQSPNYWVGYGHLPHVAQDGNVSLAIYSIPEQKGVMEEALLGYTHAYFPKPAFDQVRVTGHCAMGKKGSTYCALIGRNPLTFRAGTTDDLIQPGKRTFWIMESGSQDEDSSFEAFCERILGNRVVFDPKTLSLMYLSNG